MERHFGVKRQNGTPEILQWIFKSLLQNGIVNSFGLLEKQVLCGLDSYGAYTCTEDASDFLDQIIIRNGIMQSNCTCIRQGSGASDSSAHVHPVDNMTIQGRQSASQWTAAPMPSGYSSSNLNVGMPHYQPQVPGPSHNPFLHQPHAGNFLIL
ncbi:putative RING finger protein C4G3.12c [Forsythia ovata]|uniref:RING finger protein C4G3.12c n=1 Tax=Forsythia ovata TaxID=205694 RepID=A0ABD1XD81_9LAMI